MTVIMMMIFYNSQTVQIGNQVDDRMDENQHILYKGDRDYL